jgi:phenylalanyl-tRNA synthetase alpha chain
MQSVDKLVQDALDMFECAASVTELEQAKARYLGKSGALTELLKSLGQMPAEERRAAGSSINTAKERIEAALEQRREALAQSVLDGRLAAQALDVTLPGRLRGLGGIHPIMRSWQRVEAIFGSIGFDVADGP